MVMFVWMKGGGRGREPVRNCLIVCGLQQEIIHCSVHSHSCISVSRLCYIYVNCKTEEKQGTDNYSCLPFCCSL
jgi:hypothetical protein